MLCCEREACVSVGCGIEYVATRLQECVQIRDDIGIVFNNQDAHGSDGDCSPLVYEMCFVFEKSPGFMVREMASAWGKIAVRCEHCHYACACRVLQKIRTAPLLFGDSMCFCLPSASFYFCVNAFSISATSFLSAGVTFDG